MTDPRAPADGLTTTAFVVLGVLAFGRPLSGYQVHQWAQNTRYFHPAPAHSHVYRELRRLAGLGLVSEEPTGGRRRLYRITDAGRDRLHAWVLTPGDLLPRLQHPLLLRLFFSEAAGASDAVRPVVDAFVAETRARAVELRELADALEADPAFRLPRAIAEWGVRFCAAEVESAGAAARALGDDTPGTP